MKQDLEIQPMAKSGNFLLANGSSKNSNMRKLKRKGLLGPSQCVMCKSQEESTNHIFDSCSFASDLWDKGA